MVNRVISPRRAPLQRNRSIAVRRCGSVNSSTVSINRSGSSRGTNRGSLIGSFGMSERPGGGRAGTSDRPHRLVSRKNRSSGLT
jgi:hypothetical protein